jgi:hypothetical protein
VGAAVDDVWQAIEEAAPWAEPPRGSGVVLVWRQDLIVYHRRITSLEDVCLSRAAAGWRFGELCEWLAATRPPEEAARLAFELLGRWVSDGLLCQSVPVTPR